MKTNEKKPIVIFWWPERNIACVRSDSYDYRYARISFEPATCGVKQTGEYGVSYMWFDALPVPTQRVLVTQGQIVRYVASANATAILTKSELTCEEYHALPDGMCKLYVADREPDVYADEVWPTIVQEFSCEPAMLEPGWQSTMPHVAMLEPEFWGQAPCHILAKELFAQLCEHARVLAKARSLELQDYENIGGVHIFKTIGGAKIKVITVALAEFAARYKDVECLVVRDLHAKNMAEGRTLVEAMKRRIDDIPHYQPCHACHGFGYRVEASAEQVRNAESGPDGAIRVRHELWVDSVMPEGFALYQKGKSFYWLRLCDNVKSDASSQSEIIGDAWRMAITSISRHLPKGKK